MAATIQNAGRLMRVFISYSFEDRELARELLSKLSDAGLEVVDPHNEAASGDNVALKVGKALDSADAMVVLVSPEAMKSPSIRQEIDYALGSPKFQGRLVSVVVRPTKDMPWILERLPQVTAGRDRAKLGTRVLHQLQLAAVE